VKEAMEQSMAEGSQSFEHDIARLIVEGTVDRKEGLANADSPTNLMWRLQNDFSKAAQPLPAGRTRRTLVHRNHPGREALMMAVQSRLRPLL
jgi:Tfp pilus assembly ATPase PilU